MRKVCWILVTAFLLLVPTGCATYWYQEGKTFEECKQARAECFAELKKRTDFADSMVQYEVEYMNQCMKEKGYREVSAGDLPIEVRREEPSRTTHWRTRGIAGSLEK